MITGVTDETFQSQMQKRKGTSSIYEKVMFKATQTNLNVWLYVKFIYSIDNPCTDWHELVEKHKQLLRSLK